VVTAIVGLWDYCFKVIGHQNHAGTTTMAERKDAGLTLVRLIAAIDQEFKKTAGPRSVWTCGRMVFDPGAPSIIPGEARAMFQFRDSDPAILNRLEAALHERVAAFNKAGPCSISVETIRQSTPTLMDESFQRAIEQAAARHAPGLAVRMPSGAGHDAQHVARVMPAAMLYRASMALATGRRTPPMRILCSAPASSPMRLPACCARPITLLNTWRRTVGLRVSRNSPRAVSARMG
jgi:N-carbamoyl-L-amino-acid hydrolase